MRQITSSGLHGNHHRVGEAVWVLAGIVVLMAFGDVVTLLALAFVIATMTTAWWTYRQSERRAARSDADRAPVILEEPRHARCAPCVGSLA